MKIRMAVGLVLVASAGFAGVNYKVQAASHPDDFKTFDTAKIRERFVMEKVMSPDEINLTYTMYDRLVYGGRESQLWRHGQDSCNRNALTSKL